MKAIETTAIIDKADYLKLDAALPISGRVRVIVLYDDDELSEALWLKGASKNPVFEDLLDIEEDVYTLSDGEPFHV